MTTRTRNDWLAVFVASITLGSVLGSAVASHRRDNEILAACVSREPGDIERAERDSGRVEQDVRDAGKLR